MKKSYVIFTIVVIILLLGIKYNYDKIENRTVKTTVSDGYLENKADVPSNTSNVVSNNEENSDNEENSGNEEDDGVIRIFGDIGADNQKYEGTQYIFYKSDYDQLPEFRFQICDVSNAKHSGAVMGTNDAEYDSLFVGQLLTLFGRAEYYTRDNENLLSYAIAAEDKEGNTIYLEVYYGPSGPSIGGGEGEEYEEAADELAEIIVASEAADYELESFYEDADATVKMWVKNGKPHYDVEFADGGFGWFDY